MLEDDSSKLGGKPLQEVCINKLQRNRHTASGAPLQIAERTTTEPEGGLNVIDNYGFPVITHNWKYLWLESAERGVNCGQLLAEGLEGVFDNHMRLLANLS